MEFTTDTMKSVHDAIDATISRAWDDQPHNRMYPKRSTDFTTLEGTLRRILRNLEVFESEWDALCTIDSAIAAFTLRGHCL